MGKMQVKRGRIVDKPRTISSLVLIIFLSRTICDIQGTLASNGNSGSINEPGSSKDKGNLGNGSKVTDKGNLKTDINGSRDGPSIGDQTIQAALQFGVLVGVALMVGILF